MEFKDALPYIVSIVGSVVAGLWSYFGSRKQFKEEIKRLEKQHELDIEKERERFEMEKEKMEIEHKHQIEIMQKETENKMGTEIVGTFFAEAIKSPAVQKQIEDGINGKKSNRKNRR